jgi:transmembrane 9 superfamily protein 3
MLLVFVILVIVTICVTIVGTYFLLNAENYHWQWTSFFSAASTALYVYLYSIYYFNMKTKMSGFFQTSFYFGYTLMFCLGLGILCGELWNLCSFHFKHVDPVLTFVLFVCRCCWLFGLHSICEENLQKYQMRLNFCSLLIEAVSNHVLSGAE